MRKSTRDLIIGACIVFIICLTIIVRNKVLKYIVQDLGATQENVEILHSFNDVPRSHWAYEEIELIYSYGVTVGCSYDPPLYCPDRPATRGEMAVFAARLLEIIELGGE